MRQAATILAIGVGLLSLAGAAWTAAATPPAAVGKRVMMDIYDVTTGKWSAMPIPWVDIPYPLAVAVSGGKIFCAAHVPHSGVRIAVHVYNPSSRTWSEAPISKVRAEFVSTCAGGNVLIAGGNVAEGVLLRPGEGTGANTGAEAVDIYDGAAGTWTAASLSRGRLYLTAAAVGDTALFAGGKYVVLADVPAAPATPRNSRTPRQSAITPGSVRFVHSDVVDLYNTRTRKWSTATLSEARSNLAAASVGNEAVFAGGYSEPQTPNGSCVSSSVDIYDASALTWRKARLSQARRVAGVAVAGGKVLFAGGQAAGGGASAAVDIYDTVTRQWTVAALSEARGSCAAVGAGSRAFFAGSKGYTDFSDVVDIHDAATQSWSTARLSQPRNNIAAFEAGGKVFFAGGYGASGPSDVVDIYDIATRTWSIARLSQARTRIDAAVIVGNQVFLIGGVPSDGGRSG